MTEKRQLMAKKLFNLERYEEIKKILEDAKISSKELQQYIDMKALRYARHKEENTYTDDEIIKIVNE